MSDSIFPHLSKVISLVFISGILFIHLGVGVLLGVSDDEITTVICSITEVNEIGLSQLAK